MGCKGESGPEGRSESTQQILKRKIYERFPANPVDFVEERFQSILLRHFFKRS